MMIAAELIRRGARYYSGRTAVLHGNRRLTFDEVNSNANRLANLLYRLGLKKGDRVAFLLANSVQSVEIDFAVIKSGLVRVPLNTRLSEQEHLHMIHETEAKAVLFSGEFWDRVASLQPQLRSVRWFCQVDGPSDLEWIISLADEMKTISDGEPEVS